MRDLLLVPNLLSLLRLPLAWAFARFAQDPVAALLILFLAGLSDVLDGWWARRYEQATATGAVVDGLTDKAFAAVVVVTMFYRYDLSWYGVLALASREIIELPLVLWWVLHRSQRRAKAEDPKANWLGKLVTVVQFGVVVSVVVSSSWVVPLSWLCGVVGVLAAVTYWKRELARLR